MVRGAVLCALAAAAGSWSAAHAQSSIGVQRTVYVTAVDDRGTYLTSLQPADLAIHEAGAAREVLRAERQRAPLKVALAVEESLTPDDEVRKALAGFIDRIRDAGEIALYVSGRRNERRVPYTSEIMPFVTAINAFPARAVDQANLIEALIEIARDQRGLEGRRAVVAVARQTSQLSTVTAEGVLEQLRAGRSALYAATLNSFDTSGGPTDATSGGRKLALENQVAGLERDRLFNDGTKETGGLHLSAARLAGLTELMARIAFDLQNQFAVTYLLPAGIKSDGRIVVASTRRGLVVRGPTRLPPI